MRVLIVSRTQMRNANCVGAFVLNTRKNIRLLTSQGNNQSENTDYEIGELWDLSFRSSDYIEEPHTEDCLVFRNEYIDEVDEAQLLSFMIRNGISIFDGFAEDLFEGLIEWSYSGSGGIDCYDELLDYSVCFWKLDRDIRRYTKDGKHRFKYSSEINFPYVGVDSTPPIIRRGQLVRMSLTREFNGKCWLQLSGSYAGYVRSSSRVSSIRSGHCNNCNKKLRGDTSKPLCYQCWKASN
jgi:hypothetical protein